MIRWLWHRMLKWGWDYSYELPDNDNVPISLGRRSIRDEMLLVNDNEIDLTDPIRFSVQPVQGGTLIETRWNNPKTDNYERKLHIVTGDQDLADAIGKIVTLELLKR